MALDIGQLLGSYSAATKALLAAAGLPQQLYEDAPSQAAPDTGGAPAPAAAQAVAATSPQTAAQYLAAAGRYSAAHRSNQDFLGGATPQGRLALGGRRIAPQLELTPGASGIDALTRVVQHGQHAGQRAQVYDLGGGRQANVFIDPRTGKRSVRVF